MPETLDIKLSLTLPIVGTKTLDYRYSTSGWPQIALDAWLAMSGGVLKANVDVHAMAKAIHIIADADIPGLGNHEWGIDEPLSGWTGDAVLAVLTMDGVDLDASISVARAA
jgi:hypothetical protein